MGVVQFLKEKGMEKWLRKENLVVLVLSGILLFIITLPTKQSDRQTAAALTADTRTQQTKQETTGQTASQEDADLTYAAIQEQRLTDILEDMADVGRVRVMLTLKTSSELVVEKETDSSRSSTNENDAQGGSRIVNQTQVSDTTVYRSEGGSSEPYVIKTLSPEIEGVLVVAEGAGRGNVNKSITEIVQALFGVEAHKVKVVKMQETQSAGR